MAFDYINLDYPDRLKTFAVLDAMMGSGKTEAVIKHFEEKALNDQHLCVVFCTEYLAELESRLNKQMWVTPEVGEDDTKLSAFKTLLEDGARLIGITHKTLQNSARDPDVRRLIALRPFVLVLDETINLIQPVSRKAINYEDFAWHWQENRIVVDHEDFGRATWVDESVEGYQNLSFKRLITQQNIHVCLVGSEIDHGKQLKPSKDGLRLIAVEDAVIFKMFERVVLTTYLFEGDSLRTYLHLHGITWVPFGEVQCYRDPKKSDVRKLIEFRQERVKRFPKFSLTSTWYERASQKQLKRVEALIRNVGEAYCKGESERFAYTVPKDALGTRAKGIQPRGYGHTAYFDHKSKKENKAKSCYIPCNARAQNIWRNKDTMVHAYNRYMHPDIKYFFDAYGLDYNEDAWALNEMLQCVYRTALRDGKKINLTIVSGRMLTLFTEWLEKDEKPGYNEAMLSRAPFSSSDSANEPYVDPFLGVCFS